MTERTFRSLRYGHPGQAVYASQSREWKFVRRASNSWRFEILGEPSISILPSMQTIEPVLSSTESLQLQNQRTMRRYPETFPGALYARFESKISEIISLQTSYLDPTQGELLDFGHAVFQNSSNTVNVAAMAGGPAGELLRLLPMKAVSHGWDMARAKWIESLEPNLADVGWWSGVGQPIQQIRFAHLPYEKLTFLAIRTTVTVSVFAPVRRNSAITSKRLYPGGNSLSASRFDPNHLFTISVEQLEHSPPADVSFNPWDQRQFGVVNQLGRWSIWEFQRMNVNPKAINVRRAEQVKSGQMPKASRERADSRDVFEDGWHCIMWITNLKTVVVCSRIALVICDVSSELLSTETSELGISENTGLLLDICRHPVFENHVFVTTTTEIFWLSVLENHSANMDQAEKSRIQIQLSWTHFRDPKDTSLRTTVFRDDDDNEVILFLYSRLGGLITAFRFTMDESASIPVSVSDPICIPLPSTLSANSSSGNGSSRSINKITIERMSYRSLTNFRYVELSRGTWDEYKERGIRFYNISILWSDLSLGTLLYHVVPDGLEHPAESLSGDLAIRKPTWKRFQSLTATKLPADGIFVADGLVPDDDKDIFKSYSPPHWRQRSYQFHANERTHPERKQHTMYNLTYDRLYRQILDSVGTSTYAQTPLDDTRIDALKEDQTQKASMKEIWSDYLPLIPQVNDISRLSSNLENWLDPRDVDNENDDGETSKRIARCMPANTITSLIEARNGTPSLPGTFEAMKAHWVGPLASKTPSPARTTSENYARSVAAEVYMAGLYVSSDERDPEQTNSQNQGFNGLTSKSAQGQFNLPVRGHQSLARQGSSQAPNSSNASLSSIAQTSSTRSQVPTAEPAPMADPSASRLSHFAQMTPPPPELPTQMSKILAHWEVGLDPQKYDWEATTARLRTTVEQSQMEEEQRLAREQKMQKKKEKILRSAGRKIDRESQEKPGPARIVRPSGFASSQPTRGFGGPSDGRATTSSQNIVVPSRTQEVGAGSQANQSQSQSQANGQGPGLAVASQIEPGRFGGRGPLPAKKKAKKAQGFR